MKKLLLLIVCYIVSHNMFSQNLKWEYPVLPSSQEWKKLANHEEKISICEIPSDILQNLSTEELFDVCMNYPLLQDALFFNSLEEGLSKTIERFNGLNEFINRRDCHTYLCNSMIGNMNSLDNLGVLKLEEAGKIINGEMIIECLLYNEKIISRISLSQKKTIAKAAYSNFVFKRNQVHKFGKYAMSNSALLLCYYLNELSDLVRDSQELSEFMKTKRMDPDGKIIDELIIISSIVL